VLPLPLCRPRLSIRLVALLIIRPTPLTVLLTAVEAITITIAAAMAIATVVMPTRPDDARR
jgi:hypothetical protein